MKFKKNLRNTIWTSIIFTSLISSVMGYTYIYHQLGFSKPVVSSLLTLPFYINGEFTDASAGSQQDQIDAIVKGADAWYDEGGSRFRFKYEGTINVTKGYQTPNDPTSREEWLALKNTVFITNNPTSDCSGTILAVAPANPGKFQYSQPGTPRDEILHFDICFNDKDHVWNDDVNDGEGGVDIPSVVTHEFGHTLGLGHPEAGTSTSGHCCNPNDATCNLIANTKPTMCQGNKFGHSTMTLDGLRDNYLEIKNPCPRRH